MDRSGGADEQLARVPDAFRDRSDLLVLYGFSSKLNTYFSDVSGYVFQDARVGLLGFVFPNRTRFRGIAGATTKVRSYDRALPASPTVASCLRHSGCVWGAAAGFYPQGVPTGRCNLPHICPAAEDPGYGACSGLRGRPQECAPYGCGACSDASSSQAWLW